MIKTLKSIFYLYLILVCFLFLKVAQSCPTLGDPMDCTVHIFLQARILKWVAFPFSRGIFPTQGLKLGIPHCRWILYQLSHQGGPRILEWVSYPFSSGSSWTRNGTRVSCSTGRFFTSWPTREVLCLIQIKSHCEGDRNNGKFSVVWDLFEKFIVIVFLSLIFISF